MRLGEKFDLANAAAAELEIEPRRGLARAALLVADAMGQPAHLVDRSEIEAAAPDEGTDVIEEGLPRRNVAGAGARADEGGAFPRQRRALVMRGGGVERQGQRADFGGGAQPQVDAEDVALAGDLRQQADDLAGIALRCLPRLVALAARESIGIVEQDRVDVRGIVELARAMLAQREPDHALRLGIGHAPGQRGEDGRMERAVGEGGKLAHDLVEREGPGEIAHREDQSQAQPLAPQRGGDLCVLRPLGGAQGLLAPPRGEQFGELGPAVERLPEEGRVLAGAVECEGPVGVHRHSSCRCPALQASLP